MKSFYHLTGLADLPGSSALSGTLLRLALADISSLIKDATLRGKSSGRVFASSSQTEPPHGREDADKTPIAASTA